MTTHHDISYEQLAAENERLRSEFALFRTAEQQFRTFFDNAPIGKCMTAPDGQLMRVNRAFAEMLGYSIEELQRISFAEITHPDDLAKSRECMRCLLAGEKDTWEMQKRYLARGGNVVWTDVTTRIERNDAGAPVHFLTHILNITDRKEASEALQRNNMKLEHLTRVLKAIRNVNQLISRERVPAQLIRQTCELLVETRGYNGAWIAIGSPGTPPLALAQAGWNNRFEPFSQKLEGGCWPSCIEHSLLESNGLALLDPEQACCACPLGTEYEYNMAGTAVLRYEGRNLGALSVSLPRGVTVDIEEKALLIEIAGDVAFALHDIDLDDQRRKAKAEQQTRDQRFRSITESSPDAIFVTDHTGKYVYVNATACDLLRYSSEELLQRSIADISLKEQTEANLMVFQELMKTGRVFTEIDLLRKDGSVVPVDLNAVLLPNDLIYGSCRDLTERRQANERLRKSQALLARTESVAHVGSWEWDIATDTVIWSDELFRIMGLQPTEPAPSFAEHSQLYHPDDMRKLRAAVKEAVEHGTSYEFKLRMTMKDGTTKICMARGQAEIGAGGRTVRLFGSLQDITELKLAQHEVVQREQLLSTIATNMFDMVSLTDLDLRCTYASPSYRQLGHEPEDLVGRSFLEFVHEQDREGILIAFAEASQTPEAQRAVYRFQRIDGTYAWLESIGKVFPDGQEKPMALIFSTRNITERRELEAQLAQSDRLSSMGMLAAGVAHEINNPLSYILYNLESLTEDLPGLLLAVRQAQSTLAESAGSTDLYSELSQALNPVLFDDILVSFKDALEGTHRIRDIARGLGTFSRVEKDQSVPVNLIHIIEVAINMAQNEIKYRARLVKDYRRIPPVLASEGRLSQVFLNLIINATHAIDDGDVEHNEIRVRTWSDGDSVFAEVRDTGNGIAPENLSKLFEPFFTTKKKGVGSGLGLAISKNIVEGYGGTIAVHSQVGKGTAFVVRLPVRNEAADTAEVVSEVAEDTSIRGRILVIDDEEGIRSAMARMLRGHDVVQAPSGAEAKKLLEEDQAFDLILCDMMMPVMSGIDLHQWLTNACPLLAKQLVFITGGAFTPRARDYLGKVDNLRLEKPFDVANFKKTVSELILAHRTKSRLEEPKR